MPLPNLTEEQRAAARQKAIEARRARAEAKQRLKNGTLTLPQVLESEDKVLQNTRVSAVLEALPGVGKVRARSIMEKLDIASSRKIKGLGKNQRQSLLAEFSE
ncbi:MAG: integration host factor, actinobacterial type [Actinomycetota bacterium]